MHKLLEYICSELEDLERKTEKGDSLTMSEVQYMDTLLHSKKNLLKTEEMMGESGEYSNDRGYSRSYNREYRARGRGRNARRDSQGRYADRGYSEDSMADQLRDMMEDAPDESTRKELQRFIDKIERR